ncbi:MAG: ABC transporter ATP-binding protein [Chloroflexota bacterium]
MTIELRQVRKQYPNEMVAVRGLDLDIRDGEFFTLLGPSGCGKTTTLRMIAGLEQVSSGTITMKGRDVTRVPARDRDVAMVFQSYALYPHMTVRDNLGLNLQVRKLPRQEISARIDQVAAMLQLEAVLDRKPGQLSGGQRQRVALGRAIIRRPNVVLRDEPLSNLDLKLREETRTQLKKLHEDLRITTVYVTHDQSEAMVLADRIGIMRDGELLQVGNPHEVYARPADTFVARFIGSPSINLLRAEIGAVAGDPAVFATGGLDGTSLVRSLSLSTQLPRGPVTLGVRPEDLELHRSGADGRLAATVDLIEPMGAVSYAILRLPDGPSNIIDRDHLVATIGPDDRFERGELVWLGARGSRFSLFDSETGRAVSME